jgi:CheY-specific phosphatase CheX
MPELAILPALHEAMKEVLERMCFIEVLDDSDPGAWDANPVIQAWLTFDGAPPGRFALRVTTAAAYSISADFLGMDEAEVPGQQVGAVICELANMICGSVLSQVESTATFRLGPPQIGPAECRASRHAHTTIHSVRIANGVLTASLTTESPACSAAEKPAS